MHRRVLPPTLVLIVVLSMIASFVVPVAAAPAAQGPEVPPAGIYRGVSTAVKFDVSPPLRDIAPLVPQEGNPFRDPRARHRPGRPARPAGRRRGPADHLRPVADPRPQRELRWAKQHFGGTTP